MFCANIRIAKSMHSTNAVVKVSTGRREMEEPKFKLNTKLVSSLFLKILVHKFQLNNVNQYLYSPTKQCITIPVHCKVQLNNVEHQWSTCASVYIPYQVHVPYSPTKLYLYSPAVPADRRALWTWFRRRRVDCKTTSRWNPRDSSPLSPHPHWYSGQDRSSSVAPPLSAPPARTADC